MSLLPLCASLLRLSDVDHHEDTRPHGPVQRFFAWFNRSFTAGSRYSAPNMSCAAGESQL